MSEWGIFFPDESASCPSWIFYSGQVPINSRFIKFSPQLFTINFSLKSYRTSWTSERRAKKAREKKGANQSSQKESKATKESSSHSHDHCCNAFSLQKEAEKTPSWCRHAWTNNAGISKQGPLPQHPPSPCIKVQQFPYISTTSSLWPNYTTNWSFIVLYLISSSLGCPSKGSSSFAPFWQRRILCRRAPTLRDSQKSRCPH